MKNGKWLFHVLFHGSCWSLLWNICGWHDLHLSLSAWCHSSDINTPLLFIVVCHVVRLYNIYGTIYFWIYVFLPFKHFLLVLLCCLPFGFLFNTQENPSIWVSLLLIEPLNLLIFTTVVGVIILSLYHVRDFFIMLICFFSLIVYCIDCI